jgi:LysR family transcriptional regulator, mexEF-oprN operon transcriptional activator
MAGRCFKILCCCALLVSQMAAFTTVPSFISPIWRERAKLDTRPLPFPVPDHEVSLLWSQAHDQDPGLRWLRTEILTAFKKERAFDF